MSSSSSINFSLRQNKGIERSIVFDGLRLLLAKMPPADYSYLGFGSVWFSDFFRAHRELGLSRLVSIEADSVIFRRAQFNRPFRTVDVREGLSSEVIPELLEEGSNPWIAWLDYDHAIEQERLTELGDLLRDLPEGSVLLTTFSATGAKYGNPKSRIEYLTGLFGDVVPADLTIEKCREEADLMVVLADLCSNFFKSTAIRLARPYVPAFRLAYKDGTPMVTVGGVLPALTDRGLVEGVVQSSEWEGFVSAPIATPPLTLREVAAIQTLLPSGTSITRKEIQALGIGP